MIEVGKTYDVSCPFLRKAFEWVDEDGPSVRLSWRPGVEWDTDGYDSIAVAHGEGKVSYRVVDVVRLPKPYHWRVFFVRRFTDPDGHEFGKTNIRILTKDAFSRRIKGPPYAFDVLDLSEYDRSKLLERAA